MTKRLPHIYRDGKLHNYQPVIDFIITNIRIENGVAHYTVNYTMQQPVSYLTYRLTYPKIA